MSFQDKTLVCKECGHEFIFSVREQEFYAEKGFLHDPSRCGDCRAIRRKRNNDSHSNSFRPPREMFSTVCSNCGINTEVPFRPSNDRPVYCRECYRQIKNY